MKVTINISKLEDEYLLSNSPYTLKQVIFAAAVYALRYNNIKDADELYSALYDECTTELAIALNDIDRDELFDEADIYK